MIFQGIEYGKEWGIIREGMGNVLEFNKNTVVWEVGSNLLFEDVNYPSHALCYGFLICRKGNSNVCSFEFVIVYNYSIGNVLALTLEPTA